MIPRIGNGFDVHAMAEGRKMTLCGITIPFEKGLAGHSDADVGIHALMRRYLRRFGRRRYRPAFPA